MPKAKVIANIILCVQKKHSVIKFDYKASYMFGKSLHYYCANVVILCLDAIFVFQLKLSFDLQRILSLYRIFPDAYTMKQLNGRCTSDTHPTVPCA